MTYGAIKVSLLGTTINEIKANIRQLYLWVVVFGFLIAFIQVVILCAVPQPASDIAKQLHQNPQLFKQHPELATQYISTLKDNAIPQLLGLLGILIVEAIAYYVLIVSYLRLVALQAPPALSIAGFFHWFGQVVWKYIRPILWVLIPIVGAFIYLRSLVRYAVVSPLAVIGHTSELKTSWEWTENNWWRIFWNQLGISLLMFFVMLCIILIPAIIVIGLAFALHADLHTPWLRALLCLAQGFMASGAILTGAIFSSVLYRVLGEERGAVGALASPAVKS